MRTYRILAAAAALAFVSTLLGSGCGDGAAATKCAAACRPPKGPCESLAPDNCEQDCAAALDGLDATCADCVAEHTGWRGEQCSGGCLCGFSPGDHGDCACASGANCTAADDKCTGYEIGKVSDSDCAKVCATR